MVYEFCCESFHCLVEFLRMHGCRYKEYRDGSVVYGWVLESYSTAADLKRVNFF
jgi:hypothetical protein